MKSSINTFIVVLDEPSRVYSPGDHVHGKVVLDIKRAVEFRKVNLSCRGEVYVSWPENSGTYTRYHHDREELFYTKACVYGETQDKMKEEGPSASVLKPSTYSFSFRYTIPYKDLPPSYEARHGFIRYWMQADIENKKGKIKLKSEEKVFNIGKYNEYDEEELVEIKENELNFTNVKKTTTSLRGSCYSTGSVTLSAQTNKILYHPGEVIAAHITTDNEALRGLCTIEASLVRITVYNDAKNNNTSSKHNVVCVEKEHGAAEVEGFELVLPAHSMPPTMLNGCKCIKVQYYVQVCMKVSGKIQKEPVLMVPVIILSTHQHIPIPSTAPGTVSSDLKKNSVISNSVSSITPGTVFYVTGRPLSWNKRDLSFGLLHNNDQRGRRKRVTSLDEPNSGAFYINPNPSISYV